MCLIDMVCVCGNFFEYDKESILNDTPKNIACPKCGSTDTHRKYGLAGYDVCTGLCGNAKDGYSTGITYHGSSLVGNVKGKRIR